MENTTLDVQNINNNSFFVISGSFDDIISNKRLLLTLKRLNYESVDNKIHIPFRVENQIHILQEIQNFFVQLICL